MMQGSLLLTYQKPATTKEISVGYAADSILCWVRSKPIDSGDSRLSKHVSRIFSEVVNRTDTLQLLIYGQELVDGPRVLLMTVPLVEKDYKKFRAKGAKYIVLEIRDETVTDLWRVSRLLLEGATGGARR